MAVSVVMPALELAQETGKLVSWRKKEGERVTKGELLLEVETDKAVVEVEALADGVLAVIKAQVGDVVPVGQTIAWIVQSGELPPFLNAQVSPSQSGRQTDSGPTKLGVGAASASEQPAADGVKISPKARRLAREHDVDISRVRGSGPDGEILASDILALAGSPSTPVASGPQTAGFSRTSAAPSPAEESGSSRTCSAPPPPGESDARRTVDLEPLSSIGRLMAERTTQSWTTVPHFFMVREVDAGALVGARDKLEPALEATRGVKPTYTDLLIAIVARILRQHPRMNASWTSEGIRLNREVSIAVAVAVGDGVVAAVIHQADALNLGDIAVQRRDLTERARKGRLRPPDVSGATFTISNLGMYHVAAFTAIIVPPQAGILAVGAITDRVVPVDGAPGIRPIMTLTLSCDHRVVDGARGAAFLNDVVEAIREPEKWLG